MEWRVVDEKIERMMMVDVGQLVGGWHSRFCDAYLFVLFLRSSVQKLVSL